jgi:hypothetical protein
MAGLKFESGAAEFVLDAFDRDIDEDGYIVNEEGERETTPKNEEIRIEDFAGIEKGSELFIDDDFTSISDHLQRRREERDGH